MYKPIWILKATGKMGRSTLMILQFVMELSQQLVNIGNAAAYRYSYMPVCATCCDLHGLDVKWFVSTTDEGTVWCKDYHLATQGNQHLVERLRKMCELRVPEGISFSCLIDVQQHWLNKPPLMARRLDTQVGVVHIYQPPAANYRSLVAQCYPCCIACYTCAALHIGPTGLLWLQVAEPIL